MTRVTRISHTDDTFTSTVQSCHLVQRQQYSRTACLFCIQRRKPSWAQENSSVPQNERANLYNTLIVQHIPGYRNWHGHCCQNYKSYKMFSGLMKNSLTTSVSMTLSKSHSRLMMDTCCQPDTPTQQMKHPVCQLMCIISGSNGQLLLYVMAHATCTALLIISCFPSNRIQEINI